MDRFEHPISVSATEAFISSTPRIIHNFSDFVNIIDINYLSNMQINIFIIYIYN
jgi:hypothetical protein